MITQNILNRYNGAVQYAAEIDVPVDASRALKLGLTVLWAHKNGANLSGADLNGADLTRADLSGAYLSGADLNRANLNGAYLNGAYLSGANLSGAHLNGANLSGAYVEGSRKLIGTRPILQIGPLGSRCAYLRAYLTDQGICVRTGCFLGALEEFRSAVSKTHGTNNHWREYMAAITMIEEFAKIWTPTKE